MIKNTIWIIFALLTPHISTKAIDKTEQDASSLFENIFSSLYDNLDSVHLFYNNARFLANVLSMTNSPLMDFFAEKPSRNLDGSARKNEIIQDLTNAVTEYVPKAINKWMVPQILDNIKDIDVKLIQSPLGKIVTDQIDMAQVRRIFSDEKTGNFSYDKFVELIENHSFRKHWISVITKKVSGYIYFYSDPELYERFTSTALFTVNTFLQKMEVPAANLLDLNKPDGNLCNLIDYLFKNYLFLATNSKIFVESLVPYAKNLLITAEAIKANSESPESILINTINMDFIEPTLRVNRAYRFLTRYPDCDRYVICIVNAEETEDSNLPGVKKILSRSASLIATWFLSGKTKSSFGTLYTDIMENSSCDKYKTEECQRFHVEELGVKVPYEHKEL